MFVGKKSLGCARWGGDGDGEGRNSNDKVGALSVSCRDRLQCLGYCKSEPNRVVARWIGVDRVTRVGDLSAVLGPVSGIGTDQWD